MDLREALKHYQLNDDHRAELEKRFRQISASTTLLQQSSLDSLAAVAPPDSGIYVWILELDDIRYRIYVGRTKSLRRRVTEYQNAFQPHSPNDYKLRVFESFVAENSSSYRLILYFCQMPENVLIEEERLAIRLFDPLLNRRLDSTPESKEGLRLAFADFYKSSFTSTLYSLDQADPHMTSSKPHEPVARHAREENKGPRPSVIRAGTISDLNIHDGLWIILDIGFSKNPTCGLQIGHRSRASVAFGEACNQITSAIAHTRHDRVHLVIEAPLSMTFDASGNPCPRAVEFHNGKTRAWYVGAGAVVGLAACYLMERVVAVSNQVTKEIVLYEAFVSFKAGPTDDLADVQLIYDTIRDKESFPERLVTPDKFRQRSSDTLRSAFSLMGLDIGIPIVIKVFG